MQAVGAGLATAALMAAGTLIAQDVKPSPKPDDPGPSARRGGDPARRVPDYFGQIGLTPEQREAIYKIRGKHQAKIDELERQIDEIQAQMLVECEGVLTDTQKQMLAQRRKAAGTARRGEEPASEKAGKGQSKSGG